MTRRLRSAIEWRPPGEAPFGGHIECLIGTQTGKIRLLPATTFSKAQKLDAHNSKGHSALTLRDAMYLQTPSGRAP
ncbi:TniA putative transposase (plasmid) [Sinorhizobium fredii CCBAU 25509]|uniref:Transposase n=1 Tax=Sinorhizobium fredii (strain USDA 257) TaxID=1185652 RepID=I3XHE9_SINF2|nr:hypothetical protein USDA257_p05900 [Sinorhizobium fredii USDA 257]AWM29853.1 TniA putative transposase [Sinorhizobium fredii CCBAU 25509]CCE98948.1 hypothetical protein SFHH103_04471 [Sinorhizobium fredii HH103]CEO91361.1 hypothetical protein SFHH103_psfHH103d_165 [Sinorhizobium fredii HH103]